MSSFVKTTSPKHVDNSRRPYLFAGAAFASAGLLASAGLIPFTGSASFAGINGCVLTLDGTGDRADLQTLLSNASCPTVTINPDGAFTSIVVDTTLTLNVGDGVTKTIVGNGVTLDGNDAGRILDITSNATGKTFIEGVNFIGARIAEGDFGGAAIRVNGGALIVDDASFVDNINVTYDGSPFGGAAIASFGSTLVVRDSYFENNVGDGGSSIYGDFGDDVFVMNSTFVNDAYEFSGHISTGGKITSVLNTFVDTYALPSSAASLYSPDILLYGSQLIQRGSARSTVSSNNAITDLGGNIFSFDETFALAPSSLKGVSDSGLAATAALNSPGTTKTFALSDGVAVDIVPVLSGSALTDLSNRYPQAAGSFLMPTTDQRREVRTAPFDSGAYEFGTTLLGGGTTSSAPFMPVVLSVTPTKITIENEIVTLFGAGLENFTEVWVDGKKTEVTMVSPNRITFKAPVGLIGTYSITLRGGGFELVAPESLVYKSAAVANRARTVVPGFSANSTKLTRAMKKEIRKFVRANPGLSTVVCKGYTSLPVTPQDAALSRGRGQVTCDYIKTLNPDLKVVLRQGAHTNKPGLPIRRVQITLR